MRSLALAFLCFAAVSVHAANSGDWAQYQNLKANQFTSLTLTAQNHVQIAKLGKQMGRVDIEVWNYNNAAYDLINQFKAVTDYDAATAKIDADKREQRKTDREAFKTTCKANLAILDQAKQYLNQTATLHRTESQKKAIDSNKSFIRWVNGFVKSK